MLIVRLLLLILKLQKAKRLLLMLSVSRSIRKVISLRLPNLILVMLLKIFLSMLKVRDMITMERHIPVVQLL